MKIQRFKILAMLLGVIGCSTVPNSGQIKLASHSISYAVAGNHQPTIVLQAGLGDGKATWNKVFPALAEQGQVFAYDRPGYGGSEMTEDSRDPCSIAAEQRQLLQAAHIAPPYILVGHSIGGLYQYVFAKLYPDEVAGLVLLDATHPQHWQRMQSDAPAQAALIKGLRISIFSATERNEFDQQAQCLAQLDSTAPLSLPTIMLESGRRRLEELGTYEALLTQERQDWRQLIAHPQVIGVAQSGHYLQQDSPQQVITAILRAQQSTRDHEFMTIW